MLLSLVFQKLEVGAELCQELIGRIAGDIESAAPARPIGRERRDDQVTTGSQGAPHLRHVAFSVCRTQEEVEGGAIMPHVEACGR